MTKRTVTLLLIMIVAVVFAGIKFFSPPAKIINSIVARSKGNTEAKVQVIEFIDFECPACAYGAKILKDAFEKHPNDIRVQIKYFPLLKPHRHAMQVALYSECAGRQGKFWEFHDLLMPAQKEWSPLLSAEPMFDNFAKQVGLNTAQLYECVKSDAAAQTINDDRTLGQSLGVQSTPTYFINNKMVVGGKSLIDELGVYFPGSTFDSAQAKTQTPAVQAQQSQQSVEKK